MKAIILAAGRGSRMGELTAERPKCMCMLAGKTLLERCMESLISAGFNRQDIGIVTGYQRELLQEEGVTYFHNADWENTNMFVSLTTAAEWLEKEPCVVVYSDIVFSANAVKLLSESTAPLALTYYTGFWELWKTRMNDPMSDLETFRLTGDGRYLVEIGKKPSCHEEIQGQYMGLIRFTPESWAWVQRTICRPLPKTVSKLDMTTLLQALLEDGYPIETIATSDLWLECDTQQDVETYERLFFKELEG